MAATLATLSGCQLSPQEKVTQTPVCFSDLKDFDTQDLSAAARAFKYSCQRLVAQPTLSHKIVERDKWLPVCQKFLGLCPVETKDFRAFLKAHFNVFKHEAQGETQGLLTGYFQPEIEVSSTPSERFQYPIYKRPPELVVIEDLGIFTKRAKGIRIAGTLTQGTLQPYFTRASINEGALAGKGYELAWAEDAIDLFFMHIQGSGCLRFQDGAVLHVSYDGTNGKGYTAIGRVLIEGQEIPRAKLSMATIKAWLRAHPEKAQALLNTNESYVFFKALDIDAKAPMGAQQTPLTPLGSLAVDPYYMPLGSLVWIETDQANIGQRLLVAQDVGGAIKGPLRGDFYCGSGAEAGSLAGPLKASTAFYTLIPKS